MFIICKCNAPECNVFGELSDMEMRGGVCRKCCAESALNLVRAILIDPYAKVVSEVFVMPDLAGMKFALKGADTAFAGYVERVSVSDADDMWLDEEGCLSAHRPVFELGTGNFAGAALILAHDDDGESVGTRLSVSLVAAAVKWTSLETTGDFGESREYVTDHPVLGVVPVYEGGKPIYQERA